MSPARRDRPAFEVTVGAAALDPPVRADVVEIDVHEEVGRHGRCTLLVQNWDADARAVRHSDQGPFTPGAHLGVSLGYHSDLTPVFEGVIASITAHFPADGRPVLRVEARSKSILMEHPPRSRQLDDVSDADVASAIASDYALTTDAEAGITRPFVVSDRVSDWNLLTARAAELGWVVYVRGDTLVLRPPAGSDAARELDYTRDIVELHMTQDVTTAIDSATGVGWDPAAVEAVAAEQSESAAGLDTGDRPTHAGAAGEAGWPLRALRDESDAVTAADAADARAVGRQRDAALAHVHGRGAVIGDPSIRCDSWLTVTGIGARLSGPLYVTAARHRLSAAGYRTEFQVGRAPALTPPPATATRAAGLALGVVEDLDDPQGACRVKVRLPWRTDGGSGVWARLASLDAGDGYGTVFVPNVGQEVVVGYVDGSPTEPVVLGQLYNGAAAPPIAVDAGANAIRTIVTPGGHTVTLDDGDPATVSIASAKGHSLVIDDTNGTVALTHEDTGNAITLSSAGIEIAVAQGDLTLSAGAGAVKIDAVTLEGKAQGASRLESSATFDLKASGPLGLKGALVTIN